MTREEAIGWLKVINKNEFAWDEFALQESQKEIRERCEQGVREAIGMAIEALQFAEHFDLLKEHESLQEVVRCKDCKWHKLTDNNETEVCTNKQWDISMAVYPIISADDFCSYGERREPDKCE